MDTLKIYSEIKAMADALIKTNSKLPRADVAYNLRKFGIERDSQDISRLIFEAYVHYDNDSNIKESFVNNEFTQFLVDEYDICYLVDENNFDDAVTVLAEKRDRADNSVMLLNSAIDISLNYISKSKNSILNTITGARGIEVIRDEAKDLLNKYDSMVDVYQLSKSDIKLAITDFIFFREKVLEIYKNYSMALIDIFGDSIKSVSPKLFDFDSIEWLDVQQMVKTIELEYDNIASNATDLMSEIRNSFGEALRSSTGHIGNNNDKSVALIMLGLNLFSHYADTAEKAAVLKKDLLTMKNNVNKDVATIKADLGRLTVIYKLINDVFIPKSKAFSKKSASVLSEELSSLLNSVYQTEELRLLKASRDELLNNQRKLMNSIVDINSNIEYYKSNISTNEGVLKFVSPKYNEAKRLKPVKPFFLLNIFTFGSANKRYHRDVYDWHQKYQKVLSQYEELQVDISLDRDELNTYSKTLEEVKLLYDKTKLDVDKTRKKIIESVSVSDEIKKDVLKYLEPIFSLLHLAKEIIESSLDNKLTRTVMIDDKQMKQLPQELSESIRLFSDNIRQSFVVSDEKTQKFITHFRDNDEEEAGKESSDDIKSVNFSQNQAIQKSIGLLETFADLAQMKLQNNISKEHYDIQLNEITSDFNNMIKEIDAESDSLDEALRQINLADDNSELKKALLTLSKNKKSELTYDDINELLKGNKTIEI